MKPPKSSAAKAAETRTDPELPPRPAWEAPAERVRQAERRYERPRNTRSAPRATAVPMTETEETAYQVLKTLVTRTPEAKRLIEEVYREVQSLRRLDKLRKI